MVRRNAGVSEGRGRRTKGPVPGRGIRGTERRRVDDAVGTELLPELNPHLGRRRSGAPAEVRVRQGPRQDFVRAVHDGAQGREHHVARPGVEQDSRSGCPPSDPFPYRVKNFKI